MIKKFIFILFMLPTLSFAVSLNSDIMFGMRSENFKVNKANLIISALHKLSIISCSRVDSYDEYMSCLQDIHYYNCENINQEIRFSVDNIKMSCSLHLLLLKIMYASAAERIYLNTPVSPAGDVSFLVESRSPSFVN